MAETAAEYIDIQNLVCWNENPRKNEGAIEKVAASIKRFGFGAPLLVRKKDNVIIAGHTRFEASKLLKLKKVPVRYMDLDPVDSRLLALADNKLGELSEWDNDKLSLVIQDMNNEDLKDIGFSEDELSSLIGDVLKDEQEPTTEQSDTDYDDVPTKSQKIAEPGGIYQIGNQQVVCGDCVAVMKTLPDASIDAIVTDPPYGISFMSKDFDSPAKMLGQMSTGHEQKGAFAYGGTHSRGYADNDNEIFQAWSERWLTEAFRVLKDGGHIIAFAATRTVHRLAVAVEDAGFEIRDQLGWCYYSGFPKSMDISKQIDKMAGAEREVVGKDKNFGASNKEEGKIAYGDYKGAWDITKPATKEAQYWKGWGTALKPAYEPCVLARKPIAEKNVASQVLKTGTGAINIDACRFGYGDPCWIGPQEKHKGYPNGAGGNRFKFDPTPNPDTNPYFLSEKGRWPANLYQCPKPSRSERDEGLADLESKAGRTASEVKNFHPTVKPVNLMRWLIRLVTPVGGLVLEPFLGSGTTCVASSLEGFKSIGIEKEPQYADICLQRIKNAEKQDIIKQDVLKIEILEDEVSINE